MENLFKMVGGSMWAALAKLAKVTPPEIGQRILDDDGIVTAMVDAAHEYVRLSEKNPFEMSVEAQIAALRRANEEEAWGIPDETIAALTETAPAWPAGKHAVRSFRIRFGEGDDGVALTFERHAARMKRVFGDAGYWRWEKLESDKEHLRLLAGNDTHKHVVEWITADLNTHRKRASITAVRGPQSLADELLVVAWMFPEFVRAIDYDKNPGTFAGGYEVNVSGDDESWDDVVVVYFNLHYQQADLHAGHRSNARSDYSVPLSLGVRSS